MIFAGWYLLIKWGDKIRYIAALITMCRIFASVFLLFIEPFTFLFYICYVLCGFSDMADGYVARKTETCSKRGEILDSIADAVMIAVLLVIMVPIFPWKPWMILWVIAIAFIRLLSWFIGLLKYRGFSALHTYANKATGLVLFAFPVLYNAMGAAATTAILCTLASLSAAEELVITILSNKLDRNIKSAFQLVSAQK
jgi:CDP-diacylglycerol--glycerol-3-phosphate 3-phosphatidyltransferase